MPRREFRTASNILTATQLLPEVQAQPDFREQRLDGVGVGVKGVRYPLAFRSGGRDIHTIAHVSMTVALPAETKDPRISRFIEVLELRAGALEQARFRSMVFEMLDRLGASSGNMTMSFPYFVEKAAPVSAVGSPGSSLNRGRQSSCYSMFQRVGEAMTCPPLSTTSPDRPPWLAPYVQ